MILLEYVNMNLGNDANEVVSRLTLFYFGLISIIVLYGTSAAHVPRRSHPIISIFPGKNLAITGISVSLSESPYGNCVKK